jgi:hypothetical protein
MMLHIVDAIEATNVYHAGPESVPVPEGFVFVSTDPVAVDILSARYLFTMVPMAEVDKVRKEHNLPSDVVQKVPLPRLEGNGIVTGEGFDSPFSRYRAFKHCEARGLGRQQFYVVGSDLWQGGRLASVGQRLGRVDGGVFTELLTSTMYYAMLKPMWDLQATCLAYLEANDRLTGSDFKRTILEAYDENGDGVIDYSEKGRSGFVGVVAHGARLMALDIEPAEALKIRFLLGVVPLRLLRKEWNVDGHYLGEQGWIASALAKAFAMSQAQKESPDPFFPGMTWGKGKWPSMQFAMHQQLCTRIYGQMFPGLFDVLISPYGQAFRYSDIKWNGAQYCTFEAIANGEDVVGKYHAALAQGADLLPFVLYVPRGFASVGNVRVPNVEETDNPELIFTASLNGEEVWRDLRLSSIP